MRLPRLTSRIVLGGFILCAVWLALVVSSPFMVTHHTLLDLSGSVGVRDNTAQFHDLSPLPKAIYSIGDVECHQLASRSYYLNGNQMPFCSRDVGLFIGLALGFAIAAFYRVKVNPIFLLFGLVPIGLDGGLQLVTNYVSTNPVRLVTGILGGMVLSFILALFMYAIEEDKPKPKPAPVQPEPAKDKSIG
jgi:uncharacterized membrane protein